MSTLISFLWHMHQPFYKDVVRNSYVMPWAYLHGTKDYFGMAALSAEFPDIHQTFNLVPSLVLQLEDYAGNQANDPMLELAFRPVSELSDRDRTLIVEQLFPVPVRTMVQPYPRYLELHQRRGSPPYRHDFTDDEIRDIQVWWTLAWIDHDRRPRELVEKGRGFNESDKRELRKLVVATIANVIPEYRRRQEEGIIEVSTTAFYHPILPILINSRVDESSVPVDVRFPEDAREQLRRSRQFMRERLGQFPRGLWPSEGSVSDDVAVLASEEGFHWLATDEGLLVKSGVPINDYQRSEIYRPYQR